jgi:hypothetical protein
MSTAVKVGITLAIIVGILLIVGAIVALVLDLASPEHLISTETAWLAGGLVAGGVIIIGIVAYLEKKGYI